MWVATAGSALKQKLIVRHPSGVILVVKVEVSWSGNEMNFYFLIFSLFFPRTVMLVFFLLYPSLYPANDLPQWADLLLGIFLPRVLILIYIYENMGYNNIWFAVHLIVMVLAYFGGGRETVRRRRVRYVEE